MYLFRPTPTPSVSRRVSVSKAKDGGIPLPAVYLLATGSIELVATLTVVPL